MKIYIIKRSTLNQKKWSCSLFHNWRFKLFSSVESLNLYNSDIMEHKRGKTWKENPDHWTPCFFCKFKKKISSSKTLPISPMASWACDLRSLLGLLACFNALLSSWDSSCFLNGISRLCSRCYLPLWLKKRQILNPCSLDLKAIRKW